jgi:membrane associated rhomboid family serine protease
LLFMALHPGLNAALIGASGGISGLMGAVFRLMFAAEDPETRYLLRERPLDAPRLSVWSMMTRRAPRVAIITWVALNIVVAVALGSVGEGMPIAWEAHLGGFFVGLLVFDLFDKGWPGETPRDVR